MSLNRLGEEDLNLQQLLEQHDSMVEAVCKSSTNNDGEVPQGVGQNWDQHHDESSQLTDYHRYLAQLEITNPTPYEDANWYVRVQASQWDYEQMNHLIDHNQSTGQAAQRRPPEEEHQPSADQDPAADELSVSEQLRKVSSPVDMTSYEPVKTPHQALRY